MLLARRIPFTSFVKALALAAVAFPIVVTVGLFHLDAASKGIAEVSLMRGAQRANAELLKLQLDEETGLRGYIVTGHRTFLDPYEQAQERFPAVLTELQTEAKRLGMSLALQDAVRELAQVHERWIAEVAAPILRDGTSVARQSKGKVYIDRFRAMNASIDTVLSATANARRDAAQTDLREGIALFATAFVLVIVTALVVSTSQRRLRQDLERERSIVASLQRAFVSGHQRVPAIDVGVAYRSATKGTYVGGDVFDVHLLRDGRAMIMVADVSGKGVDAAVETAFVKYAIRAIARATTSPAEIVRQVNQMYAQDGERWGEGSFIVLFLAILDLKAGELCYASAGHGSAYLRCGSAVRTLAVTGPALGILDDSTYGEECVRLQPSDTLLVVTDGLTESRDRSGSLLTEEGIADWFFESDSNASAQGIVDALLDRALARAYGEIADDLAVVCARMNKAAERPFSRPHVASASAALPSAR